MEDPDPSSPADPLQSARAQVWRLADQLKARAAGEPEDRRHVLLALLGEVQQIAQLLPQSTEAAVAKQPPAAATAQQLQAFGRLLRDKRNAAGLSRVQLARQAQISDSTIKFLESARHPPSRATLLRLLAVNELGLTWDEVPGHPAPPALAGPPAAPPPPEDNRLNCYVAPTLEPLRRVRELGQVLHGAGGHVTQSSAYLDPQSAAAYLRCLQSCQITALRASLPLAAAAQRIAAAARGSAGLQVIALGAGDAALEVRLVQHLLETHGPRLELCLQDLSLPLLACGLQRAAETWPAHPALRVWGLACEVHELPLYRAWLDGPDGGLPRRRVYCLLGGTLGDLEHEPRFFQHNLAGCAPGDLLLLDVPGAQGDATSPVAIQKRDPDWAAGVSPALAAWLGGPIWRNDPAVRQVDFRWALDPRCPLPGSYALEAVATVQTRAGTPRHFSMYRVRRYAPEPLVACLRGLGWEEIGVWPYGGTQPAASLRLFCKGTQKPGDPDAHP